VAVGQVETAFDQFQIPADAAKVRCPLWKAFNPFSPASPRCGPSPEPKFARRL